MKKLFFILMTMILLTGCTLLEPPSGTVELSIQSIRTRSEEASSTDEIVYCNADVKVTNTGNTTIYDCTITALATSTEGIEHYISMHYDVNIPPSKSIYLTLEWQLHKKIETSTTTKATGNSSSSSSTSTSTTTTSSKDAESNDEVNWNKNSVTIIEYFFN
jgi:NADH:ubiquinone oxidoreductase subunit